MDVFALRNHLIDDYASYIRSFINIDNSRIRDYVQQQLSEGLLWPDPLLQLNPSFAAGASVDSLVDQQLLHPDCRHIFRIKKENGLDRPMQLHQHQAEAVMAAQSGDNYILTTGTGSGKSLAYILPIVNHVLRRGSGRGIQAIIIYPMNALANSQYGELEKFLSRGESAEQPTVTFKRYTGQESEAERQEIILNPPDILLTNYVMMELLLTRPYEERLIRAARALQFLVLDELHTYRGRQGADVAMLVRRVREFCGGATMQCVGTSATLAQGDSFTEQQQIIAEVASRLFGALVKPERVIGETLKRTTPPLSPDDPDFIARLRQRVSQPDDLPPDFPAFQADPLSSWLETTFGLTHERESHRLRRATPRSISGPQGAAVALATLTQQPEAVCIEAIERALLAGYHLSHPDTGFPGFAFRLHQFISRGDTVFASLESPTTRHITTKEQRFVPDGNQNKLLLPLAFCRECGQEYYLVRKSVEFKSQAVSVTPRNLSDYVAEEEEIFGFLYDSPTHPWPDQDYSAVLERLPEDWLESPKGQTRVKSSQRKNLPTPLYLDLDGQEMVTGRRYLFTPAPFRFCLRCGVSYSGRIKSDFGKLATLASGGRSTATTILSLSAIRALKHDETLEYKARKLLSFTDNRQDASLQAGHFNDFVEVGLLRAALCRAVKQAGQTGIRHDLLPQKVFEALNLPFDLYANNPEAKFRAKQDTEAALREILAYRLYHDLRRGWRVTAPNLEQCGLLRIEYLSLDDLCQAEEEWQQYHEALVTATPQERARVSQTLLDLLRRSLAIKVDVLDSRYQERLVQRSSQQLKEPWAIDENEKLENDYIAYPTTVGEQQDYRGHVYVSAYSGFGMYLRRKSTFDNYHERLNIEESRLIISQLFRILTVAGLLEQVAGDETNPGYQIPAAALLWQPGDGTPPPPDLTRMAQPLTEGKGNNRFFTEFYTTVAAQLVGLRAREHTAQVPADQRQRREEEFREAKLPVLYCSPTMELGVDIDQLNAVNMRNVPPTPANYAQRSGRAGRSGQPALVFTYCTTGSPHDQYFFNRPAKMVAGSVTPPRLDLANQDLIEAHVQAVWLSVASLSLGNSLKDVLDVLNDPPSLTLLDSVVEKLQDVSTKTKAKQRISRILQPMLPELEQATWYDEGWLDRLLQQLEQRFDTACQRWRSLYQAALSQRQVQHQVIIDVSRPANDKKQAKRLRQEAETQLDLMTQTGNSRQSDFYSYRYFASEGFLPGYNFPRLPLMAYIPARGGRRDAQDEFLSRPRFLAISEFGPRSVIYHEGARYLINKVILPTLNEDELLTTRAKLCPDCGYLHPQSAGNPDNCEHCGKSLTAPLTNLFRLENVATKRRDRINSDEEERVRMGYELKTGVRFNSHAGRPGYRTATVQDSQGQPLFKLTYGDAATLWRINKGWRRRKKESPPGFVLDTERGYWAKNEAELEADPDDPMSASTQRVIPFVDDHRNCLLIEPSQRLDQAVMASLQPALKNAIQVTYELEDNELAAEALPDPQHRQIILLYEAAEGGAGALRQIFENPQSIAHLAATALDLCHFDETGNDVGLSLAGREGCAVACYDCLMSYYNQPDHDLLNRHLIRDTLLTLTTSTLQISAGAKSRSDHLTDLKRLCDSELERAWLDMLERHSFHLPDSAQRLIESCNTRPDFFYREQTVAIYIDGPNHDHDSNQRRDAEITECLENLGYQSLRFSYRNQADWPTLCRAHGYIFGEGKGL